MRVLKFGGTSVADPPAIDRLIAIVRRERDSDPRPGTVVVVSALARVTDALLGAAEQARRGDGDAAVAALEQIRSRHLETAASLLANEAFRPVGAWIDEQIDHLRAALRALAVLRELPPRSLDGIAAVGELLSSRIVSAVLDARGIASSWVDPRQVIVTDEAFTAAVPKMPETFEQSARTVVPHLIEGRVAVTGGFVGATTKGVTTTLGRGGGDYSAAIIGAAIGADEIQIWTDVDGMLTADPRVYPSPRLVPQLSFGEAAELAYFGAKVLHPKTIQPALAREIPVRILNSRRPEGVGTRIVARPERTSAAVTAFACKRSIVVIDVTSTGMLDAHGFLRRLFEVFERFHTPVDVVTTSEVSVSMTIDSGARLPAIVEALSAFADVVVEPNQALIGIVGDHLQDEPGTFARIVGAIGKVPLKLVSQAASRRNVTLVLADADLPAALAGLHAEFFGDRETVGQGATQTGNLAGRR